MAPRARVLFPELPGAPGCIAAFFTAAGLRSGDRVAVRLPNGFRWLAAALGAHLAGMVAVPINTWYRSTEFAHADRGRRPGLSSPSTALRAGRAADLEAAGYGRCTGGPAVTGTGGCVGPQGRNSTGRPGGGSARRPGPGRPGAGPLHQRQHRAAQAGAPATRHCSATAARSAAGSTCGPVTGLDRGAVLLRLRLRERATGRADPRATLCLQERVDGDASLAFIERERCTVYYGLAPTTRALLAAPAFGTSRHLVAAHRDHRLHRRGQAAGDRGARGLPRSAACTASPRATATQR